MTAKRFTLLEDTNGGLDTLLETMVKDNEKFLTHKECCDLLNEQHEQIQRLKQNIDELLSVNVEEELLKENEQLKSEIREVRGAYEQLWMRVYDY